MTARTPAVAEPEEILRDLYAWMRWVQILAPTREQYEALKPLLLESLEHVKAQWRQGNADRCST